MHELATGVLSALESGDVEGARTRFAELQQASDELSELLYKRAEPAT